jgi:hypothetical protein
MVFSETLGATMTPSPHSSGPSQAAAQRRAGAAPHVLPAWSVYAWPSLVCRAEQAPEWQLTHLGTHVVSPGDDSQPCTGHTLWGSGSDSGAAAVAWDWVRLCPGVVALADPLGLITNLHFVDDHGDPLPSIQAALRLNQLVRSLPWQTEVQRALEGISLN